MKLIRILIKALKVLAKAVAEEIREIQTYDLFRRR